jgi:hypothetical protein
LIKFSLKEIFFILVYMQKPAAHQKNNFTVLSFCMAEFVPVFGGRVTKNYIIVDLEMGNSGSW